MDGNTGKTLKELSINKEYGDTDHVAIRVEDLSGMSALYQ